MSAASIVPRRARADVPRPSPLHRVWGAANHGTIYCRAKGSGAPLPLDRKRSLPEAERPVEAKWTPLVVSLCPTPATAPGWRFAGCDCSFADALSSEPSRLTLAGAALGATALLHRHRGRAWRPATFNLRGPA